MMEARNARTEARAEAAEAGLPSPLLAAPLSFRRNFSWALAGNIVYALCQWGMIMALAKAGTPEAVGQFSLGMAVSAPVMMLANLQLRGIQATDVKREYLFSDYFGLRLAMTALGMAVIGVAAWLSGYKAETAAVILAVGAAKAVESVSDVFQGIFQQRERMDLLAYSMTIKGVLALAVLAYATGLTGSALHGALGLALAWLATLLVLDVPMGRAVLGGSSPFRGRKTNGDEGIVPRWRLGVLKRLFFLSLPLGLTMMLISLNANIPRYFIERSQGERELGIFSALAYLMVAGGVFINALGQSASPRLARRWAQGDKKGFLRLVGKLALVGLCLGGFGTLAAAIGGRWLLALVYAPEYATRADILVWLMAAMSVQFAASFLGYGATAARCLGPQLPVFAVTCLGTTLASLLLVPPLGLLGGALAVMVSSVLQFVLSALLLRHALKRSA